MELASWVDRVRPFFTLGRIIFSRIFFLFFFVAEFSHFFQNGLPGENILVRESCETGINHLIIGLIEEKKNLHSQNSVMKIAIVHFPAKSIKNFKDLVYKRCGFPRISRR